MKIATEAGIALNKQTVLNCHITYLQIKCKNIKIYILTLQVKLDIG